MLLLPIVVTPILSRLYLPSDFGDWGVFSSFVSIYTLALFAGYENALVKVTEEEISYTATLCIVISLMITIATTLAFYLSYTEQIKFSQELSIYWITILLSDSIFLAYSVQ